MRHILKAEFSRSEEYQGSHGRDSIDSFFNIVCNKCGVLQKDEYEVVAHNDKMMKEKEYEHNLDKLFELLEGVQKTINRSGIKRFIKLK